MNLYLGRLPKVDLIILEGENVRPSLRPYVRTSVRPSVRPQKVSSISMKFGIWHYGAIEVSLLLLLLLLLGRGR